MSKNIRLIALDMDGTLFNTQSQITKENQQAIRAASDRGITVVISTGRPYIGLPKEQLFSLGVEYAITTNGAALYRLMDDALLYSDYMSPQQVCPMIEELQKKDIHMDAFIDGGCYCVASCRDKIDLLSMPLSIREYIKNTRVFVPDLAAYIRERQLFVQKMTLNFYRQPDGSFLLRDDVIQFLSAHSTVSFVCGGYHNIEFTKYGVTKGTGLENLCKQLQIPLSETMACGDTENDIPILNTAAVAVAMGNATPEVKQIADFVTLTNDESGVAPAINHFLRQE